MCRAGRLVAVAGVIAAALLSGCSGKSERPPVAASPPAQAISFAVSGGEVAGVAVPGPAFPDGVRGKVTATLERYLDEAVLAPLRSGRPAGELGPVFTGPARARATGPDRPALLDEGLPPATGLRADAATARLAALGDAAGAVAVVTAAVELRLRTGGTDAVTIVRTGELVLVPDGDAWLIDGYDIRTTRDSTGAASTTTTARA